MTERERFIALTSNEPLKSANAIVVLEGDGFNRLSKAHELYRDGWAPRVLISGGVNAPERGCYPATQMASRLSALGVPESQIIIEEKSLHTRQQAIEVLSIAKQQGWRRILLVASHYHQYRAYLTFLRVSQEWELTLEILNAPACELSWFEPLPYGSRASLLVDEFQKIEEYGRLGHIATFEDALLDHERKDLSAKQLAIE
ncbi:MAG: YdcF family protein [Acidobacteriota bacterium]